VRGRPQLRVSYEADSAVLPSGVQKVWLAAGIVVAVAAVFVFDRPTLSLVATAFVAAIGAIGLNLVTGWAGQISLGHAFFLGIGAYVGAALSGAPGTPVIGLGLDMVIWLPAAGLVAALIGALVSPIALRVKGLYLALVTIGLVLLGEHIFRNWRSLTGGQGQGREPSVLSLFGYRFDQPGTILGVDLTREQLIYLLMLALMVVMTVIAKNLTRGRLGRAFSAIRDRDIAAEVIGVNLTRYKVVAFALSSFYAGVAGALLFSVTGFVEPSQFNLLLSVAYLAMVVIGGAASIAGSVMGAFFIVLLPEIIERLIGVSPVDPAALSEFLTVGQLERVVFGLLIVVFIVVEPLGLYGIWLRIRNYWKAFPFSY
jgi:branched-chain amino acid transport system permease protein